MKFELDFLDKIQMKRTPFLDKAMPVVSNSVALYPLVDFILLTNKKTRRDGLIMAVSLTMSAMESNFILKNLFKRARPYMQRSHIKIRCRRIFPSLRRIRRWLFRGLLPCTTQATAR